MIYDTCTREYCRFLTGSSQMQCTVRIILRENAKEIGILQRAKRLQFNKSAYELLNLKKRVIDKFLSEGFPLQVVTEFLTQLDVL